MPTSMELGGRWTASRGQPLVRHQPLEGSTAKKEETEREREMGNGMERDKAPTGHLVAAFAFVMFASVK